MPDHLVTIATFTTPAEASIARNALEAAGIRAVLSDEVTVDMAWYLATALHGIKLQVAGADVQRAGARHARRRFGRGISIGALHAGHATRLPARRAGAAKRRPQEHRTVAGFDGVGEVAGGSVRASGTTISASQAGQFTRLPVQSDGTRSRLLQAHLMTIGIRPPPPNAPA